MYRLANTPSSKSVYWPSNVHAPMENNVSISNNAGDDLFSDLFSDCTTQRQPESPIGDQIQFQPMVQNQVYTRPLLSNKNLAQPMAQNESHAQPPVWNQIQTQAMFQNQRYSQPPSWNQTQTQPMVTNQSHTQLPVWNQTQAQLLFRIQSQAQPTVESQSHVQSPVWNQTLTQSMVQKPTREGHQLANRFPVKTYSPISNRPCWIWISQSLLLMNLQRSRFLKNQFSIGNVFFR